MQLLAKRDLYMKKKLMKCVFFNSMWGFALFWDNIYLALRRRTYYRVLFYQMLVWFLLVSVALCNLIMDSK